MTGLKTKAQSPKHPRRSPSVDLSARALSTPEPFVRFFARRVQQEGALDLTVDEALLLFKNHGGGRIVAEGTPEQVAAVRGSYTGRFLAELLRETPSRRAAR